MRLPILALLLFLARPVAAGVPAPGFSEVPVVSGLAAPTAIAFLPDGRLLVAQQSGELLVAGQDGSRTLLATIPTCRSGMTETGLLGIAVHPNFPADRTIYLYRSQRQTPGPCDASALSTEQVRNELVRGTLAANDTLDVSTLAVLLTMTRPVHGFHNAGGLRIGPDRKLYVPVGDGATGDVNGPPGSSTNPNAQNLGVLEGKILRLELDGSPPADNPFVGRPGARPEIYAFGFRNPWRIGFDPVGGRLWATDVGQNTIEEIDVVTPGGDYGWPACEGNLPAGCPMPGQVGPVFTYPHSGPNSLGNSVIGGTIVQGGALDGHYVFADFGDGSPDGEVYAATLDATRTHFLGRPRRIVSQADGPDEVVSTADGAVYYVSYDAGEVRRVTGTVVPLPGCDTVAECQAVLDAALPDPATAPSRAHRRVARRIARLDRQMGHRLERAARVAGRPARRRYRRARASLLQLLAVARRASATGRLAVPLASLEAAAGALEAVIPAG